jgi:LysR family transcriptional regulator, transcriptional activator for dmlA
MDSISDLAFFALLVQQGNMVTTAREMGVTPSSVTRRLASIERRLSIRLINRTTRRMSVTHEGELYLAEGKRILDDIEDLERLVTGGGEDPRGLLRVNATLGFGRQYIGPAIEAFVEQYPDVEVQLHLSDRPVNLIEDGYDVCVRFGEMPDARITARKLANNRRFLYAAPSYLKRFGTPKAPRDLQLHRCIVIRQDEAAFGTWHMRMGSSQETVKVRGIVSTNDGETAFAWALAGLGILLRSEWHAATSVENGQLVPVLTDWQLPPADIYAVYPIRRHLSAKVKIFVDFLERRLAKK